MIDEPAGWYPDPAGTAAYRYFDGQQWAPDWSRAAPGGTMTFPYQLAVWLTIKMRRGA